ncbi:amino acid deaminase [Lacimicrobium alkaliphilum]|uniref:Aldolase n=1 Tax=Lacimicrobium alkaliphilum TaxID=1526571 RepID=A0ABQ1R7B9_9ALTE|nr:amino acid deaminase [Lacimicrobium alkaliphilum]GGD59939.1 aldolase [Lacimicrobium alkaliphilum]
MRDTAQTLSDAVKGTGCKQQLDNGGWQILNEDVSLPIAVLNQRALNNNLDWMRRYAHASGVSLAPHGKTTMAPELFHSMVDAGAWAISLATAPQVAAAHQAGIKRILMANQLVGKANMQRVGRMLEQGLEYYCFVDSADNAKALSDYFDGQGQTLNVLLEVGVPGGRCGVRTDEQAMALCDEINSLPGLALRGLAFYEGVIGGADAANKIRQFVQRMRTLALNIYQQKGFAAGTISITGAGSAWYDLVAETLEAASLPAEMQVLIRPGCYLIHDTGIYEDAQAAVMNRSTLACDLGGDLINSLQLWAYVQSIPEPGMAIIGLGKRDVAFDAGLPVPQWFAHPGQQAAQKASASWKVSKIMDQHAMMDFDSDAKLQVGDIVGFSTSHPCLTMDKWKYIAVVDDNLCVHRLIKTEF